MEQLLATKLYIPSIRTDLVPRSRLIEKLNDGLDRKLTLICAPAGFGKSTLVTDWVLNLSPASTSEYRISWLSLDKNDNAPTRFLTYLIFALNHSAEGETALGKNALTMLQAPQPSIEAVFTSLINDVSAIPDEIVLVLDDYHVIESPTIDDALAFLIEHLPPQLHLVIVTRVDPQLSLARVRARNQLIELRASDLRFTSSEAADFLNRVMGLDLSVENIAALETRTEGWIAGLQLAAISMQGCQDHTSFIESFTGSHRFVLDYLLEEVLEQRPEDVQNFLMKTAILNRLTGSLCDFVVGQEDGHATLEMLNDANLFIVPLDDEQRWLRYHHLFADLLRQRLHQLYPKQIPILHQRASEWYKQNGFSDDAIEHALQGEAFERAANLIEDQFENYERGDQILLRRWLAEIPEEIVSSRPCLCVLNAWNLLSFGQLDAVDRSLQAAEKLLDLNTEKAYISSPDNEQLSDITRMKLVGRGAAIRSFISSYSGDVPGTIRYARQALESLPEQELQWRGGVLITLGDVYASQGQMSEAYMARSDALVAGKASGDPNLLMLVSSRLAEISRQQGKLQQVIDICERQWKSAGESGISESAVVGWLLGIWGEALAELNHLDKALDQAKKGVKLTANGGDVMYEVMANLCLVRVLFSRGDITSAQDVIQTMESSANKHDMPHWAIYQLSAWQARIWLAQGKLEAASQWAREHELDPEGELTYRHEVEYIVYARILIAQGKLDYANRLLLRLLEAAEAGGQTSSVIEILILQALAAQSGGKTDRTMVTLEQALSLAEPGGFVRIFVDEGPLMAQLLYASIKHEFASEYVQRLIAAFPTEQAGPAKKQPSQESEWVEPLTDREIEILHLLAAGFTNPVIGSRLYLATNTVKAHLRNIYGKLGVNNRTQAVTRARGLGIISDC